MILQDKVALVTGATSGIGKSTALALAKAGAKVVISGRREAEGEAVASEIQSAGGEALFVQCDVSIESQVKNLVERTVSQFGRLDAAFNNAGIEWVEAITDASEEGYRKTFDINVWGVLTSMKYEIPAMIESGGGSIINTSSVVGHIGMANLAIYVASKHAVEGLTKTAALEFAQQGVRVNAVSPAVIETDMVERFAGPEGSEARDQLAAMHPVGRAGKPDEIAHPVVFLASDQASFITGQSLPVDGGFLAQ